MDAKGVYRAPAVASGTEEEPPKQPEPKEKKEVVVGLAKKPSAADEVEAESAIEPFLTASDGKVRLVMNYPLAVTLCFAIIILLACAALVGWRLGRDSALEGVLRDRAGIMQELQNFSSRQNSDSLSQ